MLDIILIYIVLDSGKLIINKKENTFTFLELVFRWGKIIMKKHTIPSKYCQRT